MHSLQKENNKLKIALINIDPNITSTYFAAGGAVYNLKAYLMNFPFHKANTRVEIFTYNSFYRGNSLIRNLQIYDYQPDIIGFSCYCWNREMVLQYCKTLGQLLPESLIILGGPEVSYNAEWILKNNPAVSIVVCGEGEVTFREIIEHTAGCRDRNRLFSGLAAIDGIAYNSGSGIQITEPRALIKELDTLPSPYLDGTIDLHKINGEVRLETVRGCLYSCSYCLHNKNEKTVRKYSLERVKAELELICKAGTVKIIWFVDPSFNADEERALQILDFIETQNKDIGLAFEIKAELLTPALIEKFSRLNVQEVGIGLQSISAETNRNINRPMNLKTFDNNIRSLMSAIKDTCTSFDIDVIYGLPGDTIDIYKKSLNYILSLGARVYYQPLRVMPGSGISAMKDAFALYHDPAPPYNILSSCTFPALQMVRALKVNTGLDFYQKAPAIRDVMDIACAALEISKADLCEELGSHIWESNNENNTRVCNWTPDDRKYGELCEIIRTFFLKIMNTHAKLIPVRKEIETALLALQETDNDEQQQALKPEFGYYGFAI